MTRPALCLLAVAFLPGCGGGAKPIHLSGTVTYDGQPVPAGLVFFDPDVTKGFDAPGGFAKVKDGRFDTRAEGRPIVPGAYAVRIQGFDGKPGDALQPLGKALFLDYIIPTTVAENTTTLALEVPAKRK